MEQYQVSRNTIRLALDELEIRGLIYRLHGKGTYVSSIMLDETDLGSMYSFTQEMLDNNRHPITFNLALSLITPPESVREQLLLSKTEQVYKLVRLRMADDEPMILEESFLPKKIFPELTMNVISGTPLYVVMKQNYGETAIMAFEDIKADVTNQKESLLLETGEHAACLKIYRRSINDKNIPIEFTKSVARSDRFVYRTKQYNRRVLSGNSETNNKGEA